MNSNNPATCCFASSTKDQPVHLWDAFDGSLRASYIHLNAVQEVQAAQSLCFSPSGRQLLCGLKKEVCLFYVDRPGTTCEKWSTTKKKSLRQRSIISSCEFCPDESMFACGSYDGTLGIYDAMNGKVITCVQASRLGLTQLKFSPDGNRIYCGSRKEGALDCWDMRYLTEPLLSVSRSVDTNQRIYFDFFTDENKQQEIMLCSGSTDGMMHFWSLNERAMSPSDNDHGAADTMLRVRDSFSHKAHSDCMNGCSAHPTRPLLLSTSGQRKFPSFYESDDEDVEEVVPEENKVKLWYIPYVDRKRIASSVNDDDHHMMTDT